MGATLYRAGGDVYELLRLLKPGHVVVGRDAWNNLQDIADACPLETKFILRNGPGPDDTLDTPPTELAAPLIEMALRYPQLKIVAHGYNEQHIDDPPKTAAQELRFIQKCFDYAIETICLNGPFGNDPSNLYREIAFASTYVGWHLYDLWSPTANDFVSDIWTSRRYLNANTWPSWWDAQIRAKHIPTEVGIEDGGWRKLGITEEKVRNRMIRNARAWKEDGLIGACWFTIASPDAARENYYATEAMLRYWAQYGPKIEGQAIGGGVTDTERNTLREKILDVHRALNKGKSVITFRQLGDALEEAYEKVGEAVNYLDQIPKA